MAHFAKVSDIYVVDSCSILFPTNTIGINLLFISKLTFVNENDRLSLNTIYN